jgi:hypothetical protein
MLVKARIRLGWIWFSLFYSLSPPRERVRVRGYLKINHIFPG